jgi:hypothetical protein
MTVLPMHELVSCLDLGGWVRPGKIGGCHFVHRPTLPFDYWH